MQQAKLRQDIGRRFQPYVRTIDYCNQKYSGYTELLVLKTHDMSANRYLGDGCCVDAVDLRKSLDECGTTFVDVADIQLTGGERIRCYGPAHAPWAGELHA